ncbi:hypothetical protein DITRI_Ditri02bG0076600 [Diplodiscus trichospermus]
MGCRSWNSWHMVDTPASLLYLSVPKSVRNLFQKLLKASQSSDLHLPPYQAMTINKLNDDPVVTKCKHYFWQHCALKEEHLHLPVCTQEAFKLHIHHQQNNKRRKFNRLGNKQAIQNHASTTHNLDRESINHHLHQSSGARWLALPFLAFCRGPIEAEHPISPAGSQKLLPDPSQARVPMDRAS